MTSAEGDVLECQQARLKRLSWVWVQPGRWIGSHRAPGQKETAANLIPNLDYFQLSKYPGAEVRTIWGLKFQFLDYVKILS